MFHLSAGVLATDLRDDEVLLDSTCRHNAAADVIHREERNGFIGTTYTTCYIVLRSSTNGGTSGRTTGSENGDRLNY